MAFIEKLILTPTNWSIWMIIGIITTILTAIVARMECKNRGTETNLFASDCLRITSAVSIGCGLTTPALMCLSVLPGVCILQWTSPFTMLGAQFVSMGFYQLSRLHYCFSQNSAQRRNGYPKWIFIAMVTFGSLLLASFAILHFVGEPLPSSCGFKSDYTFEWKYRESSILFTGDLEEQRHSFYTLNRIIFVAASLWDLITLLLYCHKIRSFRKVPALQQNAVWHKIMFILQHILVITLFYQISFLALSAALSAVVYVSRVTRIAKYTILNALLGSLTVLLSVSMYLMIEHNTESYVRFLRCFKWTYLKYICFCCGHRIVDRQLKDLQLKTSETGVEDSHNESKSITSTLEISRISFITGGVQTDG